MTTKVLYSTHYSQTEGTQYFSYSRGIAGIFQIKEDGDGDELDDAYYVYGASLSDSYVAEVYEYDCDGLELDPFEVARLRSGP